MNDRSSGGFIVLESNYRLYAYTISELHLTILSLFVKLNYHLPNMAVGSITRESIRTALANGISAEQIIKFLNQNVHPQLANDVPAIPETVTDQIRLWEAERNRVAYDKGVLYDSFPSEKAFNKVVQHAKELDVYIWSTSNPKQFLMVTEEGHEKIRPFIKKAMLQD